ncbi:Na+/H+ antiporter [Actinoplanes subglobosus]|uniref:Na+/H+ antiporter n=1 Tax=Actinoplanes subglobosus TaxID=1547892 RepID=A0ABV8IZ02_9ACTN
MLALVVVVVLGAAMLASGALAVRLRLAPPVLLLGCGVLLGFVPALREVHLPPETVLLLFLPALLYWESLTTSLREIRRDLRGIILMGTVLVVLTAGAVAATAHALGLPWGPAWVLGAALAPTDATAVGVLARRLPRRNVTLLRAESLINDGTALVIYALAVGITVGEQQLTTVHVSWLLLLAYGGGALAGLITAWAGVRLRRRLNDPMLGNVAMLIIPFTAFLLAEVIEASGVVAVVICGLVMSQAGPRAVNAETRSQAVAFWSLATFMLNGALFVLVGIEVQAAVRGLNSVDLFRGTVAVAVVAVVMFAARLAFLFVSAYTIRGLDRRPQQRLRRISHRARMVSAIAGFRGAVSLAAALAVPATLASGQPFPGRDTIVFVTAGVIVVTLVVQAPLLPVIVRWARLPHDVSVEKERRLAETTAIREALAELPALAAVLGTDPQVTDALRREYDRHLEMLMSQDPASDGSTLRHHDDAALRRALVAHKRATVLRLRDQGHIDDTVLRRVQARLDIEDLRLSDHDLVE